MRKGGGSVAEMSFNSPDGMGCVMLLFNRPTHASLVKTA